VKGIVLAGGSGTRLARATSAAVNAIAEVAESEEDLSLSDAAVVVRAAVSAALAERVLHSGNRTSPSSDGEAVNVAEGRDERRERLEASSASGRAAAAKSALTSTHARLATVAHSAAELAAFGESLGREQVAFVDLVALDERRRWYRTFQSRLLDAAADALEALADALERLDAVETAHALDDPPRAEEARLAAARLQQLGQSVADAREAFAKAFGDSSARADALLRARAQRRLSALERLEQAEDQARLHGGAGDGANGDVRDSADDDGANGGIGERSISGALEGFAHAGRSSPDERSQLAALRDAADEARAQLSTALTSLWDQLLASAPSSHRVGLHRRRGRLEKLHGPGPITSLAAGAASEDEFVRKLAIAEIAGATLNGQDADASARVDLALADAERLLELDVQRAEAQARARANAAGLGADAGLGALPVEFDQWAARSTRTQERLCALLASLSAQLLDADKAVARRGARRSVDAHDGDVVLASLPRGGLAHAERASPVERRTEWEQRLGREQEQQEQDHGQGETPARPPVSIEGAPAAALASAPSTVRGAGSRRPSVTFSEVEAVHGAREDTSRPRITHRVPTSAGLRRSPAGSGLVSQRTLLSFLEAAELDERTAPASTRARVSHALAIERAAIDAEADPGAPAASIDATAAMRDEAIARVAELEDLAEELRSEVSTVKVQLASQPGRIASAVEQLLSAEIELLQAQASQLALQLASQKHNVGRLARTLDAERRGRASELASSESQMDQLRATLEAREAGSADDQIAQAFARVREADAKVLQLTGAENAEAGAQTEATSFYSADEAHSLANDAYAAMEAQAAREAQGHAARERKLLKVLQSLQAELLSIKEAEAAARSDARAKDEALTLAATARAQLEVRVRSLLQELEQLMRVGGGTGHAQPQSVEEEPALIAEMALRAEIAAATLRAEYGLEPTLGALERASAVEAVIERDRLADQVAAQADSIHSFEEQAGASARTVANSLQALSDARFKQVEADIAKLTARLSDAQGSSDVSAEFAQVAHSILHREAEITRQKAFAYEGRNYEHSTVVRIQQTLAKYEHLGRRGDPMSRALARMALRHEEAVAKWELKREALFREQQRNREAAMAALSLVLYHGAQSGYYHAAVFVAPPRVRRPGGLDVGVCGCIARSRPHSPTRTLARRGGLRTRRASSQPAPSPSVRSLRANVRSRRAPRPERLYLDPSAACSHGRGCLPPGPRQGSSRNLSRSPRLRARQARGCTPLPGEAPNSRPRSAHPT
jgi:hypothetical protein